mgnify:CR=1 FL=1
MRRAGVERAAFLAYAWVAAFLVAPLVVLAKLSLSDTALAIPPYAPQFDPSAGWAGLKAFVAALDLEAYGRLAADRIYADAYLSSLGYALASTVLLALIGYPMALAMPPPALERTRWVLSASLIDLIALRGIYLPRTAFTYLNLGPTLSKGLELSLDLLEWTTPPPTGTPPPTVGQSGLNRLCVSTPDLDATIARFTIVEAWRARLFLWAGVSALLAACASLFVVELAVTVSPPVSKNADAVATWTNLGSSAKNVTQGTGSAQPSYRTAVVGGQPVVRCDGGDRVVGALASDWDFMVDSTDKTVEDVWSKPTTAAGAMVTVASTVLGSAQNQHYHNFVLNQSYAAIMAAAGIVVEAATTGSYTGGLFYSITYQLDDDGGAGIEDDRVAGRHQLRGGPRDAMLLLRASTGPLIHSEQGGHGDGFGVPGRAAMVADE